MKKIILSTILAVAIPSLVFAFTFQDFTNLFKKEIKQEITLGDQASFIVLTGSGNKYLKPVGALWGLQWAGLATSTTGCLSVNSSGWISPSGSVCGGSGGASPNWVKETNYGVLNLTASTTIPYWAKDAFYASSTSVFQGLASFGNASTSQISATNSYLGTVLTGTWNGTAIGVAYGGTGQTSFGQGWLNSDGTTITSSTSPTVAYITATSTTATSTLTDLNFPTTANIFYGGQRFITASTSAAGNLTIGYQSATGLDANGGLDNTGVGYQAMGNATSTSYNTAVGYQALKGSATISNTGSNVAIGYKALTSITSGSGVGIGYKALTSITSGSGVGIGNNALTSLTTGVNNAGIGISALASLSTGSSNMAMGNSALGGLTSGSNNVTVGAFGLQFVTTSSGNTAIGNLSGRGAASASSDWRSVIDTYMTFIGFQASRDATIASTTVLTNGTAIGKNARVAQSNALVLGGTDSDAVNVGIGTTSPWAKLSIQNTYGSQQTLFDIASSTSAAYATSSLFKIDAKGHISASSTVPVLTSCGTSPTLDGTDFAGTVFPGATATGCTVTFANDYAKTPHCVVSPQTGSVVNTFTYTLSTTAITVTETGLTNFDYICIGF